MEKNYYDLNKFLKIIEHEKEFGLVVARDEQDLVFLEKELEDLDLVKSDNLRDLVQNKKKFLRINNNTNKNLLNFVFEYPTGSIQIKSKDLKMFKWFYPKYKEEMLIVICTEEDLKELFKKQINLYNYTTLIYRNLNIKV